MDADDIKRDAGYGINGNAVLKEILYYMSEDALHDIVKGYCRDGNKGAIDTVSALVDDAIQLMIEANEEGFDEDEVILDNRERARAINEVLA